MTKPLLHIIVFCTAIAACLALGKLTVWVAGGLPASLYGMLYFCLLLHLKWISADSISALVERSLAWMPIVFLPVCVGVMEYQDILRSFGFLILAVGVITTLLTIACVGYSAQIYDKRSKQ